MFSIKTLQFPGPRLQKKGFTLIYCLSNSIDMELQIHEQNVPVFFFSQEAEDKTQFIFKLSCSRWNKNAACRFFLGYFDLLTVGSG